MLKLLVLETMHEKPTYLGLAVDGDEGSLRVVTIYPLYATSETFLRGLSWIDLFLNDIRTLPSLFLVLWILNWAQQHTLVGFAA